MVSIKTKDDWWKAVADHKDDLRYMVSKFHPVETEAASPDTGLISVRNAERACQVAREEIFREEAFLAAPLQRFDLALGKKDWQSLRRLFGATWFGVPESMGAWSIPAFGVLCDLCSEDLVFEAEDSSE